MKINFLSSFAYHKALDYYIKNISCWENVNLMIDSGAFSAFHSGVTISLNSYLDYIEKNVVGVVPYFEAIQLDVIGDPEKTKQNLLISKKAGFNLMPVFTRGERYEAIDEMYELHDYICAGGLKGLSSQRFVQHIVKCAKGRKLHLLGYGRDRYIKTFRPYSFDTSNINDCQRFGKLCYYNEKSKKLCTVTKKELYKLTSHLSFVTNKSKYYKSIDTYKNNNSLNSMFFSQFYAYIMQMIDYYYLYNVRSYISVSSWQECITLYVNEIFNLKEVKEKIAFYESKNKGGLI